MIMKKIILSLLALMFVEGIFAQSQIYDVNGIYYRLIQNPDSNNESDLIASVTTMGNTDHYQGSISIPSSVTINGKDYIVGAINDMAFKTCKGLTQIVIPASIKHIPNGAFYGCENLNSIVVANGNPVYDSRDNCNAVVETATNTLIAACKNTIVPTSVPTIGECAFYGCKGLSSLIIPDNVTDLERWAFLDCTDLLRVVIPSSINRLNDGVFFGCNNLFFEFPSNITSIGTNALCQIGTLLWNYNYAPPAGITYNSLVFGDSVTTINWNIPTRYLKSLHIPSNVKSIRNQTELSIDGIEDLYWNTKVSLNVIRGWANTYPSILKTVVFGDSVENIDTYVFLSHDWEGTIYQRCPYLETIIVEPGNPYYDSRGNCNGVIESVSASVDGDNYHHDYIKDRLVLGCKNTIIPSSTTSIGNYAFAGCKDMNYIAFPDNVISIGEYAFSGCSGIINLNIPTNVITIGECAFSRCDGLMAITVDPDNNVYDSRDNCNAIIETNTNKLILACKNTRLPSSITSIGSYAFADCKEMDSITIPSSVTSIGSYAFLNCSSLTSIKIPSGVSEIAEGTFYGCSGLTSIEIPSKVQSIGNEAFAYCYGLTSLNIPDGVEYIGDYAFISCNNLVSLEIPASIRVIGSYAFYYCQSLKSIIIPEGVKTIDDRCFMDCNSLSYISLPSTISLIGQAVFDGCDELETSGPKGGGYNYEFNWQDTIPANAFYGLSNLKKVFIPKYIKAVYECDVQDNKSVNNPSYTPAEVYPYLHMDYGSVGSVFNGCDNLKEIAVSFTDTKLMRLWRDEENLSLYTFKESPMDFNLYKLNPVQSITILDDSIKDLSSVLTKNINEITLSEYVKDVDVNAFDFTPYSAVLDRFYYNQSMGQYSPRNYDLSSNLEKITVESGNNHYSSVDGVLLNKNGNRLLLCPSKRKDGYSIPETVVTVDAASFKGCKSLKFVNIPSSVELVGERAFEGCDSIDWIIFEGSPEIGLNAFNGCQNIRSVTAHSFVPGIMDSYDSPQTIMVGDYEQLATENMDFIITPIYSDSLERTVTNIKARSLGWECYIRTDAVTSGQYKVMVGILPSIDGLPSYFHPTIYDYNKDGQRETIFSPRQKIGPRYRDVSYSNDVTRYDSIEIAEALTIPEDFDYLVIGIRSSVNNSNLDQYSNSIVLDRIFFEPIGDDFPEEAYAGPFTQKVFNNAMLYVPDGAVSTYQAAAGWKLFKNICIDDAVDPIRLDDKPNGIKERMIYDSMGRKVETESIEQLAPGLYIIGGSTFLVQ